MISSLELARLCNVSQGTVDRALHGRAGISEATRERILRAAAVHGHRPHPAAREILTGRSRVIQAALPAVNNIFFMDLADRLAAALRTRGLQLQIAPVKEKADVLAVLEDAAARRHPLAILIPPEEEISIPETLSRHLPVVSLVSPCRGRNVAFLSPNEETTGSDGVDFLHEAGHREIAFLSSPRRAYAVTARAAGYRKRMTALGLQPRVLLSPDPDLWGKPLPTAVFCHNDWLALQSILALRQKGIAVPDEISILGIDNSPTFTALCPELTTMAYPVDAVLGVLLARVDGEKGTRSLDAERFPVIVRRSVAPPRRVET